jgi:hypothetical protein
MVSVRNGKISLFSFDFVPNTRSAMQSLSTVMRFVPSGPRTISAPYVVCSLGNRRRWLARNDELLVISAAVNGRIE